MTPLLDFLQQIDLFLLRHINLNWTNDFFDLLFPAITDLHKTTAFKVIFIPLVLILFFYFRRWIGIAIFFGLSLTIGIGDFISGRLKHVFQRSRPFEVITDIIQRSPAGGYGFPSNHSLNMFCAAIFLSYFFPRYKYLFFFFAALIAWSRIYNGVHYPSDVLGGLIIGLGMGYVGARTTQKLIQIVQQRKQKNG